MVKINLIGKRAKKIKEERRELARKEVLFNPYNRHSTIMRIFEGEHSRYKKHPLLYRLRFRLRKFF